MVHTAPAPGSNLRLMVPKAAAALLSTFLFLVLLHVGFGAGLGSSLTTTLGVGDHTVLRHSFLVRDGARAAVSVDHGDRTSAPPPRKSPAVAVFAVAVVAPPSEARFPRARADELNVSRENAAHRPRAPPSAA